MKVVKWSLAGIAAILMIGAVAIYGYLRMTVPE